MNKVIQLFGVEGQHLALYMYDDTQHSEEEAVKTIEECWDCVEDDDDDPFTTVDDMLSSGRNHIQRVTAAQADTYKL